jgi:hypothetical protein
MNYFHFVLKLGKNEHRTCSMLFYVYFFLIFKWIQVNETMTVMRLV